MSDSITSSLTAFRRTGNPLLLARAALISLRQGRIPEIVRSAVREVFMHPSEVSGEINDWRSILKEIDPKLGHTFTREGLCEMFGGEFAQLPGDFQGTRWSCILFQKGYTLVGEYFEGKRVFLVRPDSCKVGEHYLGEPDVRHIHSIIESDRGILVSTGDARKALDQWQIRAGNPVFEKRIRKHSAGFTAAATAGERVYLGTDFSSRPNWIETLSGKKIPFPAKAYRCYTEAMQTIENRYVVSVNKNMLSGGVKVCSIFDSQEDRFVFCRGGMDGTKQIDSLLAPLSRG